MSHALQEAISDEADDVVAVIGWESWHARSACKESDLMVTFTIDNPDEQEKAAMRRVCTTCPVLLDCRRRVSLTEPDSGFWAGRFYGGQIVPDLVEKPRLRPIVEMTAQERAAWWAAVEPTDAFRVDAKRDRLWLVPLPDPIPADASELTLDPVWA